MQIRRLACSVVPVLSLALASIPSAHATSYLLSKYPHLGLVGVDSFKVVTDCDDDRARLQDFGFDCAGLGDSVTAMLISGKLPVAQSDVIGSIPTLTVTLSVAHQRRFPAKRASFELSCSVVQWLESERFCGTYAYALAMSGIVIDDTLDVEVIDSIVASLDLPPVMGWRVTWEASVSGYLSRRRPDRLRQALEQVLEQFTREFVVSHSEQFPQYLGDQPNPFSPSMSFYFTLAAPTPVTLSIYNLEGELVRTLYWKERGVGEHMVEWDGLNETGEPQTSGAYFYRLKIGDTEEKGRMILLR